MAEEIAAAELHRRTWTKEDAARAKDRIERVFRELGIPFDDDDQG